MVQIISSVGDGLVGDSALRVMGELWNGRRWREAVVRKHTGFRDRKRT